MTDRPAIDAITPEQAAHVLAHFGEGGVPAGTFTADLIALIGHADPRNTTLLALGFPGYVQAVWLAQNRTDGIERLRAISTGQAVAAA
ncbi:hypothetical protein SEA_OBLADI_61 [Gordonia phage ObLaDi]|uniref:Uncharacterized protein n=2 Tax=Cafassovirus TaxID=3425056 RepID=A0AAE7SFI3_9CAUD|nr:hypothetical protein SEA_CAFASSO_62 [Gordonia phage Cafasso]UXE03784.1 hypothetical protein SEA_OBLADI_61 [Gordonia phage ObLaDi]